MIIKNSILRIARPTDRLGEIAQMYIEGLGFELLAKFENHKGFDGIILGHTNHAYHLEFTHHRGTVVGRAPTMDNLLVFYIPERDTWTQACSQMVTAGFAKVESYNPFWDQSGATFEDLDGYRVVLENGKWLK